MHFDQEKVLLAMAAMQLISTLLVSVVAMYAVAYMFSTQANRAIWQADRDFTIWMQCEVAERLQMDLPEVHPCGDR